MLLYANKAFSPFLSNLARHYLVLLMLDRIPYGDFLALYRLVINLSLLDMLTDIFHCLLDLI
jgi:hypothetical protein